MQDILINPYQLSNNKSKYLSRSHWVVIPNRVSIYLAYYFHNWFRIIWGIGYIFFFQYQCHLLLFLIAINKKHITTDCVKVLKKPLLLKLKRSLLIKIPMGNMCKVLHTVLITNIGEIQANTVLLSFGWDLRNECSKRV